MFQRAEKAAGIEPGSIRATVLVDTLPAVFQMNEILHELREHSAGLNCGRWDYIFSYVREEDLIQPRRGSTVQGEQALGPRRPDAVTADTGRNRVLHDFWRACFLDFTVALWPVQVTSPKLALRTTTFIQALPDFEQLAGKNRGPNIGLSGCAAWRGRRGQNRSTTVKTALPLSRS